MDKELRNHLLSDLSVLGLSAVLLAGCNFVPPTESSTSATTVSDATADTKIVVNAPDETPTPTPTEVPTDPSVVPVTTNLYDDLHVAVEWHDYLISQVPGPGSVEGEIPQNRFTRLSRDYIDEFEASDDYGAVFPFLYMADADANTVPSESDRAGARYGFTDASGRIVCDGIFDYVSDRSDVDFYILTSHEDGVVRYGVLSKDGSFYSGQIYDMTEFFFDYTDGCEYLVARRITREGLTVTVYSEDTKVILDERPFLIDPSLLENDSGYVYDAMLSYIRIAGITEEGLAYLYDDYAGCQYLIDYTTGEPVCDEPESGSWYAFTGEGFIVNGSSSYDHIGPFSYVTADGDEIVSGFANFDICGGDILFYDVEDNRSVLIEPDGEIINEFEGVARYVAGEYFLYTDGGENGADILDGSFEAYDHTDVDIMTLGHLNDEYVHPVYDSVIFYDYDDGDITAVNAYTGESVLMRADNGSTMYLNDGAFCLHSSGQSHVYSNDMTETVPSCAHHFVEHDTGDSTDYICDGEHVYDPVTGEVYFDLPEHVRRLEIYYGLILVMTDEWTGLYDIDGSELFRYNSIHLLDD